MFLRNRLAAWKRLQKQAGQGLTEYAVILGIIVVVGAIVSSHEIVGEDDHWSLRSEVYSLYNRVQNKLSGGYGDSLEQQIKKQNPFKNEAKK